MTTRDPGEGSAEFWKTGPKGGPYVEMRGLLSESRVHRKTLASDPYRFVVRLGERVRRPGPLSDYAFFRIEVVREEVIRLAEASHNVVQEADGRPEAGNQDEPTSLKNLGGSPGKWNWPDLAARLPGIVKEKPFEDLPALEEWCVNNVKRIDRKLQKNPPDIRSVRAAIKKHRLNQIPGLFKQ